MFLKFWINVSIMFLKTMSVYYFIIILEFVIDNYYIWGRRRSIGKSGSFSGPRYHEKKIIII